MHDVLRDDVLIETHNIIKRKIIIDEIVLYLLDIICMVWFQDNILALIEPINTKISIPGYFLDDQYKGKIYHSTGRQPANNCFNNEMAVQYDQGGLVVMPNWPKLFFFVVT